MKKNILAIFALIAVFAATGCERHYYTVHHEHSARYSRHHHHHDNVDVHIRG